jgi:hypothetical protein
LFENDVKKLVRSEFCASVTEVVMNVPGSKNWSRWSKIGSVYGTSRNRSPAGRWMRLRRSTTLPAASMYWPCAFVR